MLSEKDHYPVGTRVVIVDDLRWGSCEPVVEGVLMGSLGRWELCLIQVDDYLHQIGGAVMAPQITLDDGSVLSGRECHWMLLSTAKNLGVELEELSSHVLTLRQMIKSDGEVVLL
jgi:hypothetical protein